MDNLTCNRCGEEYSSTYRRCPFCQEIAAERRGRPMYRHGKRLSKKERMAGAGGVMKLVALAVAGCIALVIFFGDDLAQFMGIRTNHQNDRNNPQHDVQPPVSDNSQSGGNTPDTSTDPDDPVIPDGGEDQSGSEGETGGEEIVSQPLTLSQTNITIPAGETARITAEGGSGEIVWTSSNEEIATVSGGSVTGVAGGTVTITATSGEESVTCNVTVTGDAWVSPAELSLNYTDFTLREGDPPVKMKVKGTDSPVVWTSSNVNVATVDTDGVVRRVGKGNATITAEVDGQTLTCIVRVA